MIRKLLCVLLLVILSGCAKENVVPKVENVKENGYMKVEIGEYSFIVELENNKSADELKEILRNGPLAIPCSNYGGFEKVCDLGMRLSNSDEQISTQYGDVMLYASTHIVFFYGNNSWDYTRLGKVKNASEIDLRSILNGDDRELVLSLYED